MRRTLVTGLVSGVVIGVLAWFAVISSASANANPSVRVDFERFDIDGRPWKLSQQRGQWVVVNFWATWCGPCLREIPMLKALHLERQDVTVVGVNFEEIETDALARFMTQMEVNYPVVLAGDEPLLPFEPLKGLPATFIVSPDGFLLESKLGEVDREWIEQRLIYPETTDE
jgi:thiol-disulfide isomerase/thioredoxin